MLPLMSLPFLMPSPPASLMDQNWQFIATASHLLTLTDCGNHLCYGMVVTLRDLNTFDLKWQNPQCPLHRVYKHQRNVCHDMLQTGDWYQSCIPILTAAQLLTFTQIHLLPNDIFNLNLSVLCLAITSTTMLEPKMNLSPLSSLHFGFWELGLGEKVPKMAKDAKSWEKWAKVDDSGIIDSKPWHNLSKVSKIYQKLPKVFKRCQNLTTNGKSCLKNQNAVNGLHDDMMTWSQDYLMTWWVVIDHWWHDVMMTRLLDDMMTRWHGHVVTWWNYDMLAWWQADKNSWW